LTQLVIPRLAIRPHHHLLEIGCGGGTAVAAVADHLTTGSILAIDRSGSPVTRARQRNAEHIARGVVHILQADLSELDVPERSFHTVFALNVNLFQTGDAVDLVRRALRRHGRLVLGYTRPDTRQLAERARVISANLHAGGLHPVAVDWADPHHLYLTATRT
jgi:ubiquinone/menaquinone biosynthesis C-methylase UbiE